MPGFPMDSSGFHILLYFLLLQSGSENMPVLPPPPEECWENENKIRHTHDRSQQQRALQVSHNEAWVFPAQPGQSRSGGRGGAGTQRSNSACVRAMWLQTTINPGHLSTPADTMESSVLKGREDYGHATLDTPDPI